MSATRKDTKRVRRIRLIGIVVAIFLSIPVLILEFGWEKDHLERIKSANKLRVITYNGPTTYFEGNQGPRGFEYELVREFADKLGVKLEIKIADKFEDIMTEIKAGHADMAAAGLSITDERNKQFSFSTPYQTIKQQLVYRSGGKKRPRTPANLAGWSIMVTAGSSHVERLNKLKKTHPELSWQETATETPENLLVRH